MFAARLGVKGSSDKLLLKLGFRYVAEPLFYCIIHKMNKKFFHQQQKKIITLFKKWGGNKPLGVLCKDSCSELSRLISCWVIKEYPKAKISILKGDNIFNTKRSHDILLVEENKNLFLLDPSIWQFLKRKRNILIGEIKSTEDALKLANDIYKGKWKISEKIEKNICGESKELERIIKLNIQES